MKTYNHAILIIIDDVRSDQFFDLIQKGVLKNIANYLSDGLFCKNCITTFPAITVPSHTSILTGQYMDSYEVPTLKFVDRTQAELKVVDYTAGLAGLKINDDMNKQAKTLHEMVNGNTFSAFEFIYRGASKKYGFTSREFTSSLDKAIKNSFLKSNIYFEENEVPKLCVGCFFESDVILHQYGSKSKLYINSLKKIDRSIGRIVKFLMENNYFDDTLFVITSDHGNYTATIQRELDTAIGKFGLIQKKNVYADFGGLGFFNFCEENDWSKRASFNKLQKYGPKKVNLFEKILNLDGVQQIFYREEEPNKEKGIVHIKGHNGEGIIDYKNGKTKYSFEKTDYFGYEKDSIAAKLLDGKYHSLDEWLKGTYHIDNPIIADQLPRFLNIDKRSPDIIAATDGKTVYHHLWSHDLGLRCSMNVPLLIAGKGLEKKEIPFAKVADITPTILKFLGEKIVQKMVGKPLI